MKVDAEHLARLRTELLARHRVQPEAATAFDLARAAWMAGDYDDALAFFGEAHARAPSEPGPALSLARAASALARERVEAEALAAGRAAAPGFAPLALHAALRDVPADIPSALHTLQAHRGDAACDEFRIALEHILAGAAVPLPADGDPRSLARAEGLRWIQARTPSPGVFQGLPVGVLLHALATPGISGLVMEFGVYHGRSVRLIAAACAGEVHGFDSFQGLPEAWSRDEGRGAYSTGGRLPPVPPNVRLHEGWFESTLPRFLAATPGPVRLLHIDCDLYSSTRTVLEGLRGRLVPGSVLVFDDLLGYPGYEAHELRAFEEFIAASGLGYEVIAGALLGREVAVRLTG